jgi:hypothetical protein
VAKTVNVAEVAASVNRRVALLLPAVRSRLEVADDEPGEVAEREIVGVQM